MNINLREYSLVALTIVNLRAAVLAFRQVTVQIIRVACRRCRCPRPCRHRRCRRRRRLFQYTLRVLSDGHCQ